MSALTTYAPDRIGYRYGVTDSAYAKGYHRGQDVRRRGDRGGSVVTDVDAVDGGTVVYVGRPNSLLGLTVVIDTGRENGRYESHSHMADVAVSVGQSVESGGRLGRNAEMWESPGFVDGVHDHITITDYSDGAWMTYRPEYDPLPFIEAAYERAAQTAGDTARPFNPGKPRHIPRETDMTFIRTAQHGHYSVAPGVCIAIADGEFIDKVQWVASQTKDGPRPLILDVAPDDLAEWIFNLSGCPKSQIPAPGYPWYAALNPTS